MPNAKVPTIARIVLGAETCASEHGYHVVLSYDGANPDYQIEQLRRLVEINLDGLIIYPDANNLQREEFLCLLRRCVSHGIPLVLVDRYLPGLEVSCVLSDNVEGMYRATEHLIMMGRRRLGLLAFGPEGGVSDRDRRKGFLDALRDHGLNPKAVLEAELGVCDLEISSRRAAETWLSRHAGGLPIDGVACMEDNMAYGAYLALRAAGLNVPEDVAMVGYDNLDREIYQAAGLALTSIDQPAEQIGYEALRHLLERIGSGEPQAPVRHLLLKGNLVVRRSSGIESVA